MRRREPPDRNELFEIYAYNEVTGDFTFRKQIGTRGKMGAIAGAKRNDGYIGIALGGKVYLSHHLAWYYHYGVWPQRLDHKNRSKSDNRIDNLRIATAPQNGVNNAGWKESKRKNKFPKGVYLDETKSKNPYAAIRINGKLKILGFYSSITEASEAYKKASRLAHKEFSPFK